MLATTGTLRAVLRRINLDQSPQETPERALVPKPPPLGAHGEVQCAGVQCGRSAVFGEGWGGEEGGAPSSSPPTPETASFAPKPSRSAARRGPRLCVHVHVHALCK